MSKAMSLRRMLPPQQTLRAFICPSRAQFSTTARASAASITQRSFWNNMIPRSLRRTKNSVVSTKPKSTEWNPATFFICIFLLIGSMSIQMIVLEKQYSASTRRADAKITLLREVIERLQKGEDVDVEGLLGTGDKAMEDEWAKVIQDIEENVLLEDRRPKQKPRAAANLDIAPVTVPPQSGGQVKSQADKAPPGFY